MSETVCKQLFTIRNNYATGLNLYGLLRTLTKEVATRNRIILKEDGLYIIQPGQTMDMKPDESLYEIQFGGPENGI